MDIVIIFILALVGSILFSSIRVLYKLNWSIKAYKEYWLYSEGYTKIFMSHLKLFAAILIITGGSYFAANAFSAEWKILNGGSVMIGIQSSGNSSIFCVEKGINNTRNSNFTWNQNIVSKRGLLFGRPIQFVGGVNYTHHSCESNPDSVGYDKWGPFIGLIY